MTAEERRTIRALIDERIRADAVAKSCPNCAAPITPSGRPGQPKRFCSKKCRVSFWYRETELGQKARIEKQRRARRRKGMPRRPTHEKTA